MSFVCRKPNSFCRVKSRSFLKDFVALFKPVDTNVSFS